MLGRATLAFALIGSLGFSPAARAVACDGTEKVCLDLTDLGAIQASGGTNVGGDVNADGFMPTDQGGLDWHYGPEVDLSAGKMVVDLKGFLPMTVAGQPEQVSVFEACGEGPDTGQVLGLQRMMLGYHGDNIFREYATTDFATYGWQIGIWTDGFEATGWTADQTHHFEATWDATSLSLTIDGSPWHAGGTFPFNAPHKLFTLSNRCTHYPTQQAAARFTNFRLWALGNGIPPGPDAGTPGTDDAVIVSRDLPPTLACGASYHASVQVKNTGTATWTRADGFKLGAVDDSDPFFGPDPRVWLPDPASVAPGGSYTFQMLLVAPTLPGSYLTDWRMVHEGVRWFGETATQSVTVECLDAGAPPGLDAANLPGADATTTPGADAAAHLADAPGNAGRDAASAAFADGSTWGDVGLPNSSNGACGCTSAQAAPLAFALLAPLWLSRRRRR